MDRPNLFEGVDETILKQWTKYHMEHPEVYASFKLKALQMWASGRSHYGARFLIEAIRYEMDLKRGPDDPFKINNNFTPLYARQFLMDHPRMQGFFELRSLKSERKTQGDDMKSFDKAVIGMVLLFGALLFAGAAHAAKPAIQTAEITASGGSPIPASFDEGDSQSLIKSDASSCNSIKVLSTVEAKCYLKFTDSATAPADTIDGSFPVAAAPSGSTVYDYADVIKMGNYWYLRCAGAPTAGVVTVMCF
jgi:hypothetical protein